MTIPGNCAICRNKFAEDERVIFSWRETFIFKPASEPDAPIVVTEGGKLREVSAAAVLSPAALAEHRKDYKRTAVVNTFGDWGKLDVPEGAFNFRHQWCEPVRTAAGGIHGHGQNKHAIRFSRSTVQRSRV